ncbi:MAG: radical SAM protein [bacterium]
MAKPHSIFLMLTTDCDKRAECGYCFYNLQPEWAAPSRMDTKAILNLFKQLKLWDIPNVYLTGGEPLLREDLEEIIAGASDLRLNTFLLSNGRALDSKRVERLEAAGLDVFVMSLNDLEIVDRKTIAVVSRFKRTRLSFIYVLTKNNIGWIQDITDLARALGAGLVFQPAYIPEKHKLRQQLSLAGLGPFDWSKLYTELRPWASDLGYERYLEMIHDVYHEGKLRPKFCAMGSGAVVIDADGAVYPCFHRRELECGNILRDELAEVLDRSAAHSAVLSDARCFGEHCVSLHTGYGK